ncbi:hypothetical protein ACFL2E_11815 [Thermodesulfobacteriota bacterium]
MNTQANGSKISRQKFRQEIYCDINSVWKIVEALEKKSIDVLGDTDPMTETLGFTAVHMMNASFDIEEHVSEGTNKLSPRSVTQLFEILSIIKWSGPKYRRETKASYQTAVTNVSKKYGVERNTMADLCVRRLGLVGEGGTDKFLRLVEDLLFKKGTALQELIKEHTHEHQHRKIDEFFNSGGVIQ